MVQYKVVLVEIVRTRRNYPRCELFQSCWGCGKSHKNLLGESFQLGPILYCKLNGPILGIIQNSRGRNVRAECDTTLAPLYTIVYYCLGFACRFKIPTDLSQIQLDGLETVRKCQRLPAAAKNPLGWPKNITNVSVV